MLMRQRVSLRLDKSLWKGKIRDEIQQVLDCNESSRFAQEKALNAGHKICSEAQAQSYSVPRPCLTQLQLDSAI